MLPVLSWKKQEDAMTMRSFFKNLFGCHETTGEKHLREENELRDGLSEKQIDKTIGDSFPASDPPAWTR